MWSYEHAGETTAGPAAVWKVLSNLDAWAAWDTSMQSVRLDGPFAVGSKVMMKPNGQDDEVTSTIVAITENEFYADETQFEGVFLRFSHALHPNVGGGTRVVHRLEISGAGSDEIAPKLGPAVTEDFPDAMAALLTMAESV